MPHVAINGKAIHYDTVGQTLPKGYKRISRKCKLYALASTKLGRQAESATWLHTAICAVAHGKPPGQIGRGRGKWTVDHVNGNCTDNRAVNLAWCEHSTNTAKGNKTRHSG